MVDPKNPIPIIRTKLHQPAVTPDFVERERLQELLEAGMETPLTVAPAPAGYGKSSLVSYWLESIDTPSAWLSLDQADNSVHGFIGYIMAALETVAPGIGEHTLGALDSEPNQDVNVIAAQLSNDLDGLQEKVVLVLDDYHEIRDERIHQILDQLLQFPPPNLKLIILSRRDPPLSLSSYRANNLLTEIRMDELQYSRKETALFLEKSRGFPGSTNLVNRVHDVTEGWPVGVRLAALALRRYKSEEDFLESFEAGSKSIQEYLVNEVLANLPAGTRERILGASIFNRFNNALCSAVLGSAVEAESNLLWGGSFIDTLMASGFFCIPLDEVGQWVRFHHLFRDLLYHRAEEEFGVGHINELHRQASSWFADHGLYEEALSHSTLGGDYEGAAKIIHHARHELMNGDQWTRLNEWLGMMPVELVETDIHLQLLRCWIDMNHYHRADLMGRDLDLARMILENSDSSDEIKTTLSAEISSMRSGLEYWLLNPDTAITQANFALEHAPAEQECVRSTAVMMKGAAMQQLGLADEANTLLWNHLELKAFRSPSSRARLIQVLGFISWFEANSQRLKMHAEMLLDLGINHSQPWSQSYARYFLGLVYYERNEIKAALEQIETITKQPHRYPIQNVAHCFYLSSLCHQAMGNPDKAHQEVDKVARLTLESGNKVFSDLTEAFRIELYIRQGKTAEAERGVQEISTLDKHAMTRHFDESFTRVKLLLTDGENFKASTDILDQLQAHLEGISHRRFLIDVLGMQALRNQAEGNTRSAIEKIDKALRLGLPGQLVRPLADLGSGIGTLLGMVEKNQELDAYTGKIFAAMRSPDKTIGLYPAQQPLAEPLTPRELSILELFARNMTNKEIARELNISPGTVKRHAHNIFGKLSTNNRREAVVKARNLALLEES